MPTCGRCGGSGRETYEEDGRQVTDACYHCGTTGQIDDDLAWHDRLMVCAGVIALAEESEYRHWRNNDPEGEDYDFCAAENGLRGYEYFQVRTDDRMYQWAPKLAELPQESQEFLVAWCEQVDGYPWAVPTRPTTVLPPLLLEPVEACGSGDDDIPF
jgi:hypothetical protein